MMKDRSSQSKQRLTAIVYTRKRLSISAGGAYHPELEPLTALWPSTVLGRDFRSLGRNMLWTRMV